jgi:hypothetical protein
MMTCLFCLFVSSAHAFEARPFITEQPGDVVTVPGSNAVFSVTAEGNGLAYQWYSNRTAIRGAYHSNHVVSVSKSARPGFLASYSVTVSNKVGGSRSGFASLTAMDPMQDTDGDGLTDAFEMFVSHTDPISVDSNHNGINDGDERSPGGLPWHLVQAGQTSVIIYTAKKEATEGAGCGLITVALPSPAPKGGVTVEMRWGGFAEMNKDFSITPVSITPSNTLILSIPEGAVSNQLTLCAIATEDFDEMGRYVDLTLFRSSKFNVDITPATVTLTNHNLPQIRVLPLPNWVRKPSPTFGTNSAEYYFIRDGSEQKSLKVECSYSGTATPGKDYVALPKFFTFAAGARTNSFIVTPLSLGKTYEESTLTLKLKAPPGYSLDPKLSSATITLGACALAPKPLPKQ